MTATATFFDSQRGVGTLGHSSIRRGGASDLSETPARAHMRLKSSTIWRMLVKTGGDSVICARASVPLNPTHELVTLPSLDRNYRRAGGIEETAREDFRFLITDLGPLLIAPAEALDVEYTGWLEPNLPTLRIES